MPIILEGPDGGGKTTLREELLAKHPKLVRASRASDSRTGPVDDLLDWARSDMKYWGIKRHYIYDRHPMISEYVYGHAIPERTLAEGFNSRDAEALRQQMYRDSLVIFCLPPRSLTAQKALVEDQMPGVLENFSTIYSMYEWLASIWPGTSIAYDHTRPSAIYRLNLAIRLYLNEED